MSRPSIAAPGNVGACERSWQINVGFTGAGAAALVPVKVRGLANGPAGTAKNTRVSAGLYRLYINSADLGGNALAGVRVVSHSATGVQPLLGKYVAGTLVRQVAGQLYGSIDIEFWSLTTPALTDPTAGAFVDICLEFFDNTVGP